MATIDPSIPLSVFANAPNVGASLSRAMQLKSLRQRQQLEQMQIDEEQRKLAEAQAVRQAAAGAVTPQQTQQVNMPGATLASYAAPQSVSDGSNGPQQSFSLPTSPIQLPGSTDSLTSPASFDQQKYISNLAVNPQTAGMVPGAQSQFAQQELAQASARQKMTMDAVQMQEALGKLDAQSRTAYTDATEQIGRGAGAVLQAPPEQKAQVYQQVLQSLAASPNPMVHKMLEQAPPQYQPGMDGLLQQHVNEAMSVKDIADRIAPKPNNTPGVGVPFSPDVMKQKVQLKETRPPVTAPLPGAGATPNDAKDIAQGIISGKLPPSTKGLYRNAGPVLAELGRQGYNLQQAESDWNAVQKHVATLNGSQQERLRQSISSAGEMVDKVDQLYQEWKQVGAESGIKVFNKASLATARNLPGRAGAVAQALEAQIADLTADLGNIYMGGNSPTERALELAGKSLQSDWNDQAFSEGVKQIKANVKIRQNSIANSQPAGVSGNTNYGPGNGSNPNSGGMTITLPSGKTVTIN